MTDIDRLDAEGFLHRMRLVDDLFFPRPRHTERLSQEERWKTKYLPYVHKKSGQVLPHEGHEWRFMRFDVHKAFKAVSIDVIERFVKSLVSIEMIGLFPLVLSAYEALSLEKMSYLFYRFYAPFITVTVDKEGIASATLPKEHEGRFLPRCEAEEKVTRKIASLCLKFDDMASMERSVSKRESPEDNANLGGVYQRLEPRCNRVLLREFQRLAAKILEDYTLIKEVVFADLGSGMNLVPLYASAMFGWKSLGIECVQNRVLLAAQAQQQLFEHDWFQKLRVAMFCENLALSKFNWGGILCFLCWDKVGKK